MEQAEPGPVKMPSPGKISPMVGFMLLLAGINSVINAVLLFCTSQTCAWQLAVWYSRMIAYNDSWELMNHALEYLHSPAVRQMFNDRTVYDVIFFAQRLKFQYPTTSLLFLEPLRLVHGGLTVPNALLNLISWWTILAFILVTVAIFILRMKTPAGGSVPAGRRDTAAAVLLLLLLISTFSLLFESFVLGQIQSLIDLLFAAVILFRMRRQPVPAGIFLGVMCAIKPNLVYFILWGLIRREWRFIAAFTCTLALFAGASVYFYGWGNTVDYLRVVGYISGRGESIYGNQSVNGLLNRLLFNGPNLGWEERRFAPYHPAVAVGTVLSSALLVIAGLWKRRNVSGRDGEIADFVLSALCFVMASPIVWGHHYGILLPVFAYLIPAAFDESSSGEKYLRRNVWLCGIAFILLSNTFDFLNTLADTRFNVLQSYRFFGALTLVVYLGIYSLRSGKQASAEAALPSGL